MSRPQFAVLPGGLRNLRPLHQAQEAGHPCVELFDREVEDDERPNLPTLVDLSLSLILRGIHAPGTVPRQQMVDACQVVAMWRAGAVPAERDATPPHGIKRPERGA